MLKLDGDGEMDGSQQSLEDKIAYDFRGFVFAKSIELYVKCRKENKRPRTSAWDTEADR